MRVVIAGSSGLIGTALRQSYADDGHTVIRLVRRPAGAPDELRWDHTAPDPALLDGADVLINLAGAGLGDRRWSRRYRETILRTRTDTAAALARMAAAAAHPPPVFLSTSGIRYYGIDRGDELLTEASTADPTGLLPTVAWEWEQATAPASDAGVRVCHLRLGLVLSSAGGLLPRLVPLFRAGLGTRIGSGREYWSYLSLYDTVRAVRFLATAAGASGPYNVTAPDPVRNREFTRLLAAAVHRPAVLVAPRWALRIALGGIASEVFGGLRVVPERLTAAGFRFAQPDLPSTLAEALRPGGG